MEEKAFKSVPIYFYYLAVLNINKTLGLTENTKWKVCTFEDGHSDRVVLRFGW